MNASSQPRSDLVEIEVPADNKAVVRHAYGLLRSMGHNCQKVHVVLPASNTIEPGYEIILYESYGEARRTAYLYQDQDKLHIDTDKGWPFYDDEG